MARRQASRYIMGARGVSDCQRAKSTGRESNPRLGMSNVENQMSNAISSFWFRPSSFPPVGPVGVEPTSSGLRDRRITVSATVPCSRRGRSRTLDRTLIRGPLSPLSYAPPSGAEGTRTLTLRIKSPVCCRYTTTPDCGSGVCVSIGLRSSCCSSFSVVALRVELSATCSSDRFGQPALGYLVPTSSSIQSGWQDSNLRVRAPKARGFAATLHPVESERPVWESDPTCSA